MIKMSIAMLPAITRQESLIKLSQPQPEYRRFLHDKIDFDEPLIGIKGARGIAVCCRPVYIT